MFGQCMPKYMTLKLVAKTEGLRSALPHPQVHILALYLLKQEGGGALAAVHAVKVGCHEGARAAVGALLAQALHLARVVHLCHN